jgi:hypothetical protein
MAIEVKPGMFSSRSVKPSMKAGLVMAFFTLLTLFAFGLEGNPAIVTFQLSDKGHALSVPDFAVILADSTRSIASCPVKTGILNIGVLSPRLASPSNPAIIF